MTHTNKEAVINTLTAARELQQRTGYHKGTMHNEDYTQHCMLGALLVVMNHDQTNTSFLQSRRALHKTFSMLSDETTINVAKFNDDLATTPEDIDLLWKKAIYAVETGEVEV